MKTKVLLREEKKTVEVNITDEYKPEIKDYIKERWQKVITLVAEILDVPAGLIMKISKNHMEIFLKSENEDNPYPEAGKDNLLHGLYCETVIGKDQLLHVDNSLKYDSWKDNPDVKLNMISYFGLPLKWGDGSVFGTICVLDNKTNDYENKYRDLLNTFKEMIEEDLMLLEELQTLERLSDRDFLTNIANRKAFLDVTQKFYDDYKEQGKSFALIMMDLDHFKYINDHYGHVTGDRILKRFAEVVDRITCDPCVFARYGGDEFVLVIKDRSEEEINIFLDKLKEIIFNDDLLNTYKVDISYGIAYVNDSYNELEELIEKADIELYKDKENKRSM